MIVKDKITKNDMLTLAYHAKVKSLVNKELEGLQLAADIISKIEQNSIVFSRDDELFKIRERICEKLKIYCEQGLI